MAVTFDVTDHKNYLHLSYLSYAFSRGVYKKSGEQHLPTFLFIAYIFFSNFTNIGFIHSLRNI